MRMVAALASPPTCREMPSAGGCHWHSGMVLEARQLKSERYHAIGWRSTVPRVTRQPIGSYSARSWATSAKKEVGSPHSECSSTMIRLDATFCAHGDARLGARGQRPEGRAACKLVMRGGGLRALCLCVCARARGREGGREGGVACESWCMISCHRGLTTVSE